MSMELEDGALFPTPASPRTDRLGQIEPAVHWFTTSTRDEAHASRKYVNEWYKRFADSGGRLAATLRSDNNRHHFQALDELYVYHLLSENFTDIRYEEGRLAPDFRVYDLGGRPLAGIEVCSVFERNNFTIEEQRHARLADQVNMKLPPTAGYGIDFEIITARQDPAPRHFIGWLRGQLDDLPNSQQLRDAAGASLIQPLRREYVHRGVCIKVNLFPVDIDSPMFEVEEPALS